MEGNDSTGALKESRGEGRYIYCVVEGEHQDSLGKVGIDGNEVFILSGGGLSALVHACPAFPYDSDSKDTVEKWVVTHDEVVQVALEKYGTVIPMGFDTIVKGKDRKDASQKVRDWLLEEGDILKGKMERVRGKAEYGVQILWDPELVGKKIVNDNQELLDMARKIESGSKGAAYMHRQRLEKALKKELEARATGYFEKFYDSIKECIEDIRVERTKKLNELQMLANFSCLATPKQSILLGDELEKIDSLEGYTVKYTGPWPPYSFVTGG